MDTEKKLRRARTMLIIGDGDEPFFGSVALGLDFIFNKNCPTACTDGRSLMVNPDWIDTMDIEETMTLFEHEVYHIALKHGSLTRDLMQEPDFNNRIWQQACDIPIDNRLIEKGRKMPVTLDGFEHKYRQEYEGMSAIKIYRDLMKKAQKDIDLLDINGGGSGSGGGHGDGDGDDSSTPRNFNKQLHLETADFGGILPLPSKETQDGSDVPILASKKELEEFERELEQRIANASRILRRELDPNESDLPEFVQEIISANLEPQKTYRDFVTDLLEEIVKDDYNWSKPNLKYEDIYVPKLDSTEQYLRIVVIVDTSGSISGKELMTYAHDLSNILMEFEELYVTVIFHNTYAYRVKTYTYEDLPIKFDNVKTGGTDYRGAYLEVEKMEDMPSVIFHYTDLDVSSYCYPTEKPEPVVIWMNSTPRLKNGRLRYSTPPWGKVIDLDLK